MAKIWKYVLIAVLILLALGILLGGAGLLTGASMDRVSSELGLEARMDTALENLRQFGI